MVVGVSEDSPRTYLFLSWRDIQHPQSGGAEVYTHGVLRQLVERGQTIWHFSARFKGSSAEEEIDGVRYIRGGNPITVIAHAWRFYRRHKARFNLVIDQCNTHRFFTPLWIPRGKRVFFVHHLTRQQWFELWPLLPAAVGYAIEVFALWLNRNDPTITPSPSTASDLADVNFTRVMATPQGIRVEPISPDEFVPKGDREVFLYAGRVSPYKAVDQLIRAVGMLGRVRGPVRLWVIGKYDESTFTGQLQPALEEYGLSWTVGEEDGGGDVHFFGFASDEQLGHMMRSAVALLMASSREGWGLTITECAALGTPSIVWPAVGVVDAVDHGRAGFLCEGRTLEEMVSLMNLALDDDALYARIQSAAHEFAKGFTPERAADAFHRCLESVVEEA